MVSLFSFRISSNIYFIGIVGNCEEHQQRVKHEIETRETWAKQQMHGKWKIYAKLIGNGQNLFAATLITSSKFNQAVLTLISSCVGLRLHLYEMHFARDQPKNELNKNS